MAERNPNRPPISPGRALTALAAGTFAAGTAELCVVGLLDVIAADLSVPRATVGHLVSLYALGFCVGGPAATFLTLGADRRRLLLAALAAFAVTNVVSALAPRLIVLEASRVAGGTLHGMYVGLASVAAASVVPPEKRGKAMAAVFGGLALATVVGVPMGAFIGQWLGWRATFVGIAVAAAMATCAAWAFVRPELSESPDASPLGQVRRAVGRNNCVLYLLIFGFVGGEFASLTYLAASLTEYAGVGPRWIAPVLFVYGLASAAGTFLGGHLADKSPGLTMLAANVALAASLLAWTWLGTWGVTAVVMVIVFGLAGFVFIPAFQLLNVTVAGEGASIAAVLGASVANLGIAAGAWIGGVVLDEWGVAWVPTVAGLIVAAALPATLLATRMPAKPVPAS